MEDVILDAPGPFVTDCTRKESLLPEYQWEWSGVTVRPMNPKSFRVQLFKRAGDNNNKHGNYANTTWNCAKIFALGVTQNEVSLYYICLFSRGSCSLFSGDGCGRGTGRERHWAGRGHPRRGYECWRLRLQKTAYSLHYTVIAMMSCSCVGKQVDIVQSQWKWGGGGPRGPIRFQDRLRDAFMERSKFCGEIDLSAC